LIDPDGSFRLRLERDRESITALSARGATRQLAATVHKLAGAAETFGYPEVSRIALQLDEAFAAADKDGSASPAVSPLIDALTRALSNRS
jgi:HPt (histidine-containing phosphotransfer) domain-containing protein